MGNKVSNWTIWIMTFAICALLIAAAFETL